MDEAIVDLLKRDLGRAEEILGTIVEGAERGKVDVPKLYRKAKAFLLRNVDRKTYESALLDEKRVPEALKALREKEAQR